MSPRRPERPEQSAFFDFPENKFPFAIVLLHENGDVAFTAMITGPAALRIPGNDELGGRPVTRTIVVTPHGHEEYHAEPNREEEQGK